MTRLRIFWAIAQPAALTLAFFWFAFTSQTEWVIVAGVLLLMEAITAAAFDIVKELRDLQKQGQRAFHNGRVL